MNTTANHKLLTSKVVETYVDELCDFTLATEAPQIASVTVKGTSLHMAAFPNGAGLANLAIGIDRRTYGRNGGRMLEVTSFTNDNIAADIILAGMLEKIVELVDQGVLVPTKIG